jgi:hypothetical protein
MPAVTAPARPAHRGPVLAALMVTMALSAMDNNIVSNGAGAGRGGHPGGRAGARPRRFATMPGAAASAGPANQAAQAAPAPSGGEKPG